VAVLDLEQNLPWLRKLVVDHQTMLQRELIQLQTPLQPLSEMEIGLSFVHSTQQSL